MDIRAALLESWDRECRIVEAVADRINENNLQVQPSFDGWPLFRQLSHICKVRIYHLKQLDLELANGVPEVSADGFSDPNDLLMMLRERLTQSGVAVRQALEKSLDSGEVPGGGYDHPVFLLQHLIFHEGWHVGLIFLALRLNGEEPPEPWEEAKVWGEWRTD